MIAALAGLAFVSMIPPARKPVVQPHLVTAAQGRGILLPTRAKSLRFMLVGSLFIVLVMYAGVLGVLDGEVLRGVLAIAVALLAAAAMVSEVRMRRRGARGLLISPAGVELRDRHPAQARAWEHIRDVRASYVFLVVRRPALPIPSRPAISNTLTFTMHPPDAVGPPPSDNEVTPADDHVDADELACNALTAFHFVRAYAHDPSLRHELGSDAALRRWSALAASTGPRPAPAISDGDRFRMWQLNTDKESP
ncbi:hypothetical protein GCM10027298_10310 [Epidermidibacterium keratini]